MNRAAVYETLKSHRVEAYDYVPTPAFAHNPEALIEIVDSPSTVCGRHRYITVEFDDYNRAKVVKIGKLFEVCL